MANILKSNIKEKGISNKITFTYMKKKVHSINNLLKNLLQFFFRIVNKNSVLYDIIRYVEWITKFRCIIENNIFR